MIKYYDTHAHYDDKRFDEDREQLLTEILPKSGVTRVINIGADIKSSEKSVELAEKYDYFGASVGVHPHYVKNMKDADLDFLLNLSKNKSVVAFGEIGLDFFHNHSAREAQLRRFRDQLEVAVKSGLPVIIHSRDAHVETYGILAEFKAKLNGGIIHCFSGDLGLAELYVQLGFHVAFGGVLTFPKAYETVKAAHGLPLSSIVLETDCPYIAPIPHRGKRNSSDYLRYIALKLAEIKGISREEAAEAVFLNAQKLLGF